MYNKIVRYGLMIGLLSVLSLADGYLDRGESIVRSDSLLSRTKTMVINEKDIRIVVTYPKVVVAGEYFTVKASMTNNRDYARMGGLTLSFPQMTSVAGESIYNTFDTIKGYPPYSKIYNKHRGRAKRSNYYMIEGWERKWRDGVKKTFRLKLRAPHATGRFYINVRGVLHLGGKYDRYEITIPRRGAEDQQGYSVKDFSIRIID